jgi:hypothetical protein
MTSQPIGTNRKDRENVFGEILRNNGWGNPESASGPGSTRERALAMREDVTALLRRRGIRSLLDAPCGDFHWMRALELDLGSYVGMDIVPELIERNRREHASSSVSFVLGDLIADLLPRCDLILCRDALVHFPVTDVHAALENFRRSGSTWLLTTHFVGDRANEDIRLGDWRPLNLERSPFGLPRPAEAISERLESLYPEWSDKRLALWRLSDLPDLS